MSSLRILVVEDSEVLSISLCRFLSFLGHEVTHAGNVREARCALDEDQFDLVLADVQLPDGFGPELVDDLPTQCAMVSMSGLEFEYLPGCHPRWVGHLWKPCTPEEFEAAISEAAHALARWRETSSVVAV